MAGEMTIEILDDFANAWNEHDLEKLMSHMTQDCVFELSAGPEAWGARFEGYDNVSEGYKRVLDMFPDGQWAEPSHFIAGDRGVTQWTFRATGADGGSGGGQRLRPVPLRWRQDQGQELVPQDPVVEAVSGPQETIDVGGELPFGRIRA